MPGSPCGAKGLWSWLEVWWRWVVTVDFTRNTAGFLDKMSLRTWGARVNGKRDGTIAPTLYTSQNGTATPPRVFVRLRDLRVSFEGSRPSGRDVQSARQGGGFGGGRGRR